MPVSHAMRRLQQVLEMQESECLSAMESARAELAQLEQALTRSTARERGGRLLVAASATTGEVVDRIAGIEETRTARRLAAALEPRIAAAQAALDAMRREFLSKRIERRQTETLIEEAEAADKVEAARRAQKNLDDWFLSRRLRT